MNPWHILGDTIGWIIFAAVILLVALIIYGIALTLRDAHRARRSQKATTTVRIVKTGDHQ